MKDNSVLDIVNKMIVEAERKLGITIKKNTNENNLQEIKRLIIYLKERQKELTSNIHKNK